MATATQVNSLVNTTEAKATKKENMNQAMNATEEANPSHDAISKLPPSSPQKRDFTARYVVRMLAGSFQSKCATRLRVAPPITMMLKSDPQPMIKTPASHKSTKNASRISLDVAV